jgi:hypothetical protein
VALYKADDTRIAKNPVWTGKNKATSPAYFKTSCSKEERRRREERRERRRDRCKSRI